VRIDDWDTQRHPFTQRTASTTYEEIDGDDTVLGSPSDTAIARRGIVHTWPHNPHWNVLTS
jgi:hypothetical protein